MKRLEITVSSGAYIGLALGIMVLPLDCILAAVLAAGFHECCHLFTLHCCGIVAGELRIGLLGAKISTGLLTPIQEIICALAGPIGSLSLLFLARWMPVISLFGLCQGLFNLLPIYPLDGGRIIHGIFMLAKMRHCGYNISDH